MLQMGQLTRDRCLNMIQMKENTMSKYHNTQRGNKAV